MSKEQESFDRIKLFIDHMNDDFDSEDVSAVDNALNRLEAIDNANPSEALECLESIEADLVGLPKHVTEYDDIFDDYLDDIWYRIATIKQALIKAEKEHNSLNLLMQELDCKDFADLRKYARCGYEKLNKQYLKWEDLEFKEDTKCQKAKMNDSLYRIEWYIDGLGSKVVCIEKYITNDYLIHSACIKDYNQQFFNDLHLERVEE